MKLDVQGIEEIELTDPQGLCNPPVPLAPNPPVYGGLTPVVSPFQPQPQVPTPFGPGVGDVAMPHKPPIYTRHVHDPNDSFARAKWGIGGPMIQQAGNPEDADKWQKNWQSKMTGEDNGNRSIH